MSTIAIPTEAASRVPSVETLRKFGPSTYIVELAKSFPCLEGKLTLYGIAPNNWDVDRWVEMAGPWSHCERCAALFVANVWNWSYAKSKKWRFDSVDAVSVWDAENREAFLLWSANPVWP